MLRIILFFVFLSNLGNAQSTHDSCQRSSGFDALNSWVNTFDPLADKYLPQKENQKDYQTRVGAIISKTCFADLSASEQKKAIATFEQALETAISGAKICHKQLKFSEASSAISVLRRARFECTAKGDHVFMSNSLLGLPLSIFRETNTGYDRKYKFELSQESFVGNSLTSPSEENLASRLFHEALHSLPTYNKNWHSNYEEIIARRKPGCESSIFEDRTYFLQAVCFPNSIEGFLYYRGKNDEFVGATGDQRDNAGNGVSCSNVCNSALLSVDPIESSETMKTMKDSVGPPLVAIPYKERDSEIFCERVKKRDQIARQITNDVIEPSLEKMRKLFLKINPKAVEKFDQSNAVLFLSSGAKWKILYPWVPNYKVESRRLVENIESQLSTSDSDRLFLLVLEAERQAIAIVNMSEEKESGLQKIFQIRQKIDTLIKKRCSQGMSSDNWEWICANHESALGDLLTRLELGIQLIP